MGKKQKNTGTKRTAQTVASDANDKTLLDPSAHNFIYDELDEFHEQRDKLSLGGIKFKGDSESSDEEQVLGLGNISSEEEDNEHIASSDEELFVADDDDIVDKEDAHSDDERAWGKKKRMFFGTDSTDQKIHRETIERKGKEDTMRLEEEGAKKLQERMSQQLKGLSFADLIPEVKKGETSEDESEKDKVKIDISRMSNKRKVRLLKQESPEFLPIVNDLKEKTVEMESTLLPLMRAIKEERIQPSPIVDYLKTKYCLCLNYISNVCAYMVVKTSGGQVAQHPVISRLAQYRHLFKELEPCQTLYEDQINKLLDDYKAGKLKPIKKKPKNKKKLKLLSILRQNEIASTETSDDDEFKLSDEDEELGEGSEDDNDGREAERSGILEGSDSEEEKEGAEMEIEGDRGDVGDERRPIGATIFKNRGLMPKRQKERRNPRIKYKNKYKRKLVKRKGQVTKVRTEVNRYSGEISGIKKSVIKSRKLQ